MGAKTKVHQPEVAVGDVIPDGFTLLRGASYMAYQDGIGLLYRRHFWYVTQTNTLEHKETVKHVCTSYQSAFDAWEAMQTQSDRAEKETR